MSNQQNGNSASNSPAATTPASTRMRHAMTPQQQLQLQQMQRFQQQQQQQQSQTMMNMMSQRPQSQSQPPQNNNFINVMGPAGSGNVQGSTASPFNPMAMMNMMRMMNSASRQMMMGTPPAASMNRGVRKTYSKKKRKYGKPRRARQSRPRSMLPMPGEGKHDVDPEELSRMVVRIIQDTENSFQRNLDEQLMQAERSEKKNAYRVCYMCKKSVGAFGNNFKSHMTKCCPMVFYEICRQQPAYFGSYENVKKEHFWKDWTFPSHLEDALVIYEKENERIRSGMARNPSEEEYDDEMDSDDSDEDAADEASEDYEYEELEYGDSDDETSLSSATLSPISTMTKRSQLGQPILNDIDEIVARQMQMIQNYEAGVVDGEDEEKTEVEEEKEEEMVEEDDEGLSQFTETDTTAGPSVKPESRKYKAGTLQELYSYGANASDAFPQVTPTRSWTDTIQDRSVKFYQQNATFMNDAFFEPLEEGKQHLPTTDPAFYQGLKKDIEHTMSQTEQQDDVTDVMRMTEELECRSREYWELMNKLSNTKTLQDIDTVKRVMDGVIHSRQGHSEGRIHSVQVDEPSSDRVMDDVVNESDLYTL